MNVLRLTIVSGNGRITRSAKKVKDDKAIAVGEAWQWMSVMHPDRYHYILVTGDGEGMHPNCVSAQLIRWCGRTGAKLYAVPIDRRVAVFLKNGRSVWVDGSKLTKSGQPTCTVEPAAKSSEWFMSPSAHCRLEALVKLRLRLPRNNEIASGLEFMRGAYPGAGRLIDRMLNDASFDRISDTLSIAA